MNTPSLIAADDPVAMDPADALRQYTQSDGFKLHLAHVREQWGAAAVNRKVKAVLTELPPADHSAAIQAIYGTADSIRALFAWPEEEYDRLQGAMRGDRGPVDRFAGHRRTS